MFVTSVVVGAVATMKPFTLTQRPFLRDILFYLIAVFWTFVILWQNKVTIYSAVGELQYYDNLKLHVHVYHATPYTLLVGQMGLL